MDFEKKFSIVRGVGLGVAIENTQPAKNYKNVMWGIYLVFLCFQLILTFSWERN